MIWKYKIVAKNGEQAYAYGCPVRVHIGGRDLLAVYQFPGAGQTCAVVHWESGTILATIHDRHKGAPEQQAQAALNERLTTANVGPIAAWRRIEATPVINIVPEVLSSTGRTHEATDHRN